MKQRFVWVVGTILLISCSNYKEIETGLYFGLSKPGGLISPNDWAEFSQTELGRVFPSGYTELDAWGKWRGAGDSLLSEPSKLVIAIHKRDKSLDKRIDSACMAYKKLFQQEAVLRVDKKVKMKLN
jgi:hypothetical protein